MSATNISGVGAVESACPNRPEQRLIALRISAPISKMLTTGSRSETGPRKVPDLEVLRQGATDSPDQRVAYEVFDGKRPVHVRISTGWVFI